MENLIQKDLIVSLENLKSELDSLRKSDAVVCTSALYAFLSTASTALQLASNHCDELKDNF